MWADEKYRRLDLDLHSIGHRPMSAPARVEQPVQCTGYFQFGYFPAANLHINFSTVPQYYHLTSRVF